MRFLRSLPLVPALLLVGAVPAVTLAPLANARADAARAGTMDVADIKIGMKGYGLTVFKGTEPEKFDIEIVGILHDFRPAQDLILIKAKNERLDIAHTVAGMSGSPIFIDGKVIGAYAYGWQFGSEAVSGVTPIKNMLQDLARPVPANWLKPIVAPPPPHDAAPVAGRATGRKHASADGHGNFFEGEPGTYDLRKHAKQIGERVAGSLAPPTNTGLAPASTMISLSGMSDHAAKMAGELLSPMGFETMQGGGAGGKVDPNAPTKFVDGGAIEVELIRGDFGAHGLGTVTHVVGDKLVAFGHPMMQSGISALPTAIGTIHWILATSIRSFKLGEPVRPMGALVNDMQSSIVVDSKVDAPVFPVHVKVEGVEGAPKTEWNMEVAHDRFLSPSFLGVAMGSTVESTVKEKRDATWRAKTKIQIKNYGTIEVEDFGVAIGGTPDSDDFVRSRASRAVGQILNNPWEWAQIERVDLDLKIAWNRDVFTIRGCHALEDSVDAGQKARIQVRLWQFNGADDVRTIEVPIPKELAGKDVDIFLAPGWMESPDLPSPENLTELIANLPKMTYAPDVLLAEYRLPDNSIAYRGKVAPSLPPSALDTLRATGDTDAPEILPTTARIPFPMGHLLDGHDHVRVHVKDIVR